MDKQISYGDVIEYFDVSSPDLEEITRVIPNRFLQDFSCSFMKIHEGVPPHTDSQIKATINFYVKTSPCQTVFYKTSEKAQTYQIESQTNGVIFNEADLEISDAFEAQAGEAWLLDVTVPHSVKPIGDFTGRTAITLATGLHDYNAVKNMLHETGNL